ncbi:MAG: 50S ribosomal protein L18 [Candidatus Staskawiczbacteria bacterium]|nr:50S ribosomal protein L18 [Candidatus Staskawiczbacteria bacterium]
MQERQLKRKKRHRKIRRRIHGTKNRPRLCVFRSLSHIYAQLIDDDTAKILASASSKEVKNMRTTKDNEKTMTKNLKVAFQVGKLIAQKAVSQKIERVVFDRGGIIFHGRVKALADGAREGGLIF